MHSDTRFYRTYGDKTGRLSLDRNSKRGWKVPSNTTMIKLVGGEVDYGDYKFHIKDMDDFVKFYEPQDVEECLMQFVDSREDIETLKL